MKKVNIIAIAIILGLFSCTQTNKKNNTEQKVLCKLPRYYVNSNVE